MNGNFVDTLRYRFKKKKAVLEQNFFFIATDYGDVRVFDTKEKKPVLLSVPDGPNVIEHHQNLISKLSRDYRVICFEYIGVGQSYPNSKYDYSCAKASRLIINVMDSLCIERAALCFSCSNGFYAIKAAEQFPERIHHLFLSQTPSLHAMEEWTASNIPKLLKYPVVGQIVNSLSEEKLIKTWYRYALPKETDRSPFIDTAINNLNKGGCFCLSGLVQGLENEKISKLHVLEVPSTLIWGAKDYTHRKTDYKSILEHLPNCEIIEFENCGHFPELEATDRYVELLKEALKT